MLTEHIDINYSATMTNAHVKHQILIIVKCYEGASLMDHVAIKVKETSDS